MTASNVLNGMMGWSTGYDFAITKKEEDTVRQGKNYYLSGFLQCLQTIQLSQVISSLTEFSTRRVHRLPLRVFSNILPIAFLPVSLFLATIKHDHYETFASASNDLLSQWKFTKNLPLRLPKKLGRKTVKVLSFAAEHAGNMMRVAMIAGAVALIVLGNTYMGGALLAALSYELIDRAGFIPRKISLLMEMYMPIVSTFALLAGGNLIGRINALIQLPLFFSYSLRSYVHNRIDHLIHSYTNLKTPTLVQLEAPLEGKSQLTFEEINRLLNANEFELEINPSHFTKWAGKEFQFKTNKNLRLFQTLFNTVKWAQKYQYIKCKLVDDEIFIHYLKESFPESSREKLIEDFDQFISLLAYKQKMTKEEFLAKWMKEQMATLTRVITGKQRVKGSQKALAEAIDDFSKVLPYLIELQNTDKILFEDMLLKMTVEGGDYCAPALKRVAKEFKDIIYYLQRDTNGTEMDPVKDYETKILKGLEDSRYRIIQEVYEHILNANKPLKLIGSDIHAFDIYRKLLSFGFYPLTDYERKDLGTVEILLWESFYSYRTFMYDKYQRCIDQVFKEILDHGDTHFGIYLRNIINTNPQLSESQKEVLLEKFTENNDGKWKTAETNRRFHRIILYKLGVIKIN